MRLNVPMQHFKHDSALLVYRQYGAINLISDVYLVEVSMLSTFLSGFLVVGAAMMLGQWMYRYRDQLR